MKRKVCNDNPNAGLSFLYNTKAGRIILKPIVKSKMISSLTGRFLDLKISKILIKPFIKKHNINMDDYENKNYESFNDFFIRKVKKGKRIVDKKMDHLISPCDGKLTVHKISKDLVFKVKNSFYSINSVLKNKRLANLFTNGYALVFRLSPEDFHRYVFIDDGKIMDNYKIDGLFHSVNPISYDNFKVFKENQRECTYIKTKNFSDVMYIEVGALLVGKIKNNIKNGYVKKGMEKGYFMYGGSTIIILLKDKTVKIDNDILKNSKNGFETCVKCGEKIGKKSN